MVSSRNSEAVPEDAPPLLINIDALRVSPACAGSPEIATDEVPADVRFADELASFTNPELLFGDRMACPVSGHVKDRTKATMNSDAHNELRFIASIGRPLQQHRINQTQQIPSHSPLMGGITGAGMLWTTISC